MSKIFYIILLISSSYQKTIFLFEHIRHSHRSPDFKTENTKLEHRDIFNNEWKSSGLLTRIGKRSAFLQGYRTRLYYKDFLSDPSPINAISLIPYKYEDSKYYFKIIHVQKQ